MTSRRRPPARPSTPPTRALFEPRELKKLTLLMEESGLVELEIASGDERVRLVRGRVEGATPVAAVRAADVAPAVESGACVVASPMVGIFHRAAAAEAPVFAEVGDVVDRGQVLCLIEAMQMMNEVEAERRGRIVKVVVENGRPVEFGEPLFLIEPV